MKRVLISLLMLVGLAVPTIAQPALVGAVAPFDEACSGAGKETALCRGTDDRILGPNGILRQVINILLTIVGIISVIVIIVGGIRYTTSYGDSGQIKLARETIIYAVIGLVVAIMSFALVNYVLANI